MAAFELLNTVRMPVLVTTGDLESALPLELTQVTAKVTGLLASVGVVQRYSNPLREPVELDYLFPLPENAAVTGFEIQMGSRRILGDLQERETAQATYAAAREQGKRAGLFEQRRPNLFAMRLANVQPGEVIQASVQYQQRIKFDDGTFEFVYPMGLTPKYDRPQHPEEGLNVHAPIARGGEKIGLVEIDINVDPGVVVRDPSSPSHKIHLIRVDDRCFQVKLAAETIPDHDFVMRYELASEKVEAAGWTSGEKGKEYFLATLMPPRMEAEPQVLPREFVFVLDRSGSMSGEPIAQARNALRACLRSLNPVDCFRILLFDNELEWFQKETLPVTQQNIDGADAYLARVEGRGGTEILLALEAALGLPVDTRRNRYVVFLTDGAVSAEAQALDRVRSQVGAARLFTFGVGPSVNRALLSRLANLGRGKAEFLQLDEDIEGAIIRFQDRVSFPVLTNLRIEWENAKTWDVYPARLPDLYYGEPVEICGRLARTGGDQIRLLVKGEQGGQPLELGLSFAIPENREKAVERIWAQARVEDLLEQQALQLIPAHENKADILALAFEYHLVTLYTSFVAVDQETAGRGEQKPRVIHIAQPLPQGLSPEGFMGGAPMKAMGMMMPMAGLPPASMPPSPMPAAGRSLRAAVAKIAGRVISDRASQGPAIESAPLISGMAGGREQILRWLARTQKLDGSWNNDVEFTSAAVLAFVRAGYTTRSGSFRQTLRRAVTWLVGHPGRGFASFARVLALEELARATANDLDTAQARAARLALAIPTSDLERAAAGEPVEPPGEIRSLDDLRLAVMLKTNLAVPEDILHTDSTGMAVAWSAVLG